MSISIDYKNNVLIAPISDSIRYKSKAPALTTTSAFQSVSYPIIDLQNRHINLSAYSDTRNGKCFRFDQRFDYYNPSNTDIVYINLRVGYTTIGSINLNLSGYTFLENDHILIETFAEHMVDGSNLLQGPCHFGCSWAKVSNEKLLSVGGEVDYSPKFAYGASYPTLNKTYLYPGAQIKVDGSSGKKMFVDNMTLIY